MMNSSSHYSLGKKCRLFIKLNLAYCSISIGIPTRGVTITVVLNSFRGVPKKFTGYCSMPESLPLKELKESRSSCEWHSFKTYIFLVPTLYLVQVQEIQNALSIPFKSWAASSLVRVILSCLQEEGLRESLCLTRIWEHWTCSGPLLGTGLAALAGRSHWLAFVYVLR